MKKIHILIIFIFINTFAFSQSYNLIWSDEFDSTELDISKWEYMIGDGTSYNLPAGWGNNELQWYQEDNVRLEDSNLIITARKENVSGRNYTSSRIRTRNKGDWTYGRFEFRAKMPIGKGIWPAIWLLPTDNVYGGWAASGEIDIVEYLGHEPSQIHGTLYYGGAWPNQQSTTGSFNLSGANFSDDFHVFALEWEEGSFKWFVDDSMYQSFTSGWSSSEAVFPAPFDQDFHLILNIAVGGNWPGSPDGTTSFPQEFVVDYVRVYEIDNTSGLDEIKTNYPGQFVLEQNYPNPFNPSSTISYQLSVTGAVELSVYTTLGQKILTLVSEVQQAGRHSIEWNASAFPSGVYFYRLETRAGFVETKKLILLK